MTRCRRLYPIPARIAGGNWIKSSIKDIISQALGKETFASLNANRVIVLEEGKGGMPDRKPAARKRK
jgi:hypothetical protein